MAKREVLLKKCAHCGKRKPLTDFKSLKQGEYRYIGNCTSCNNGYRKQYYLKNKGRWKPAKRPTKERRKANLLAWKMGAFKHLGGVCVHCGFSDIRALQIDHVNGGGCKEARLGLITTIKYKAVMTDKTGKYQLLCANCNWIKNHERKEYLHERYTND
jgi:hypothetical protein